MCDPMNFGQIDASDLGYLFREILDDMFASNVPKFRLKRRSSTAPFELEV